MKSKGYSEEARKRGVSRQAVTQAQRALDGLCIDCGGTPVKGQARCKDCLETRATRARNRYAERKGKP